MTIAVNPRTDPTERSMFRDTMISTIPVVMTATAADWTERFQRKRGVRNRPSDRQIERQPQDGHRDEHAEQPDIEPNGGQRGPQGPRSRFAAALGVHATGLGRHGASISRRGLEVTSAPPTEGRALA